jgi:amidase
MGTGDPYTAPAPARPWRQEIGADPGSLRIGFRTDRREGMGPSHPECVAAVEATASLLAELGHQVDPTSVDALDHPGLSEALPLAFSSIVARDVERWGERIGRPVELDELEPMNAMLAEMGRTLTATQWLAALETLQSWSRGVAGWWTDHDVLVLPTSPEPPPRLGETGPTSADPFSVLMGLAARTTFTFPFNVTGQPAVSLPLHWSADGLPIGVQLVAAYGREDVLIRLASQLEVARPWADRRPPVAA